MAEVFYHGNSKEKAHATAQAKAVELGEPVQIFIRRNPAQAWYKVARKGATVDGFNPRSIYDANGNPDLSDIEPLLIQLI